MKTDLSVFQGCDFRTIMQQLRLPAWNHLPLMHSPMISHGGHCAAVQLLGEGGRGGGGGGGESGGPGITTRVDNQAAISAADLEALALDAQPSDLALLQQLLQAGEVLNFPGELALEDVIGAGPLGLAAAVLGRQAPLQVPTEHAGLLDEVEGGAEDRRAILDKALAY